VLEANYVGVPPWKDRREVDDVATGPPYVVSQRLAQPSHPCGPKILLTRQQVTINHSLIETIPGFHSGKDRLSAISRLHSPKEQL
jgi:hypothetical protein